MTPEQRDAFETFMALGTHSRANVLRAWATQIRGTDAGMAAWCLADLVHFGVATCPDTDAVEDMADSADKLRWWADEMHTAAFEEIQSRMEFAQ